MEVIKNAISGVVKMYNCEFNLLGYDVSFLAIFLFFCIASIVITFIVRILE